MSRTGENRGRSAIMLGLVAAWCVSTAPLAARADSVTLCGQKVDYRPAAASSGDPGSRDLVGIWIGDILALNVPYSVDYQRCMALAIESVEADGKVKAKLVLADSAKNMHTGTSYGTKGYVIPWTGLLGEKGTTLRFASDDGKTAYDLQRVGATRMEGRVSYSSGYGRLFLVRQ